MKKPSIKLSAKLKDETQWDVKRGVPLFCEHDEVGPDGQVVRSWDAEKIRAIAAKACEAFEKRGHAPRITIGHTKRGPEVDESTQPPLVGFLMNYREEGGELVCDHYRYPDKAAEADEFPYRSIELFPGTLELAGCALLKRDPKLQLGVMCYSADGNSATYATSEDDDGFEDRMMQCLHRHPAIKHLMRRYMDETGDVDMGGMAKYMAPVAPDEGKGMPAVEMTQYQKDIDGLKAELKAEREARLVAEKKANEASRRNELVQLQRDGYGIDAEEMLKEVKDLPQEHYERQLAVVKKYVPRSAQGDDPGLIRVQEGKKPQVAMSREDMQACVQYHRAHPELTWESAMAKYKEGK